MPVYWILLHLTLSQVIDDFRILQSHTTHFTEELAPSDHKIFA